MFLTFSLWKLPPNSAYAYSVFQRIWNNFIYSLLPLVQNSLQTFYTNPYKCLNLIFFLLVLLFNLHTFWPCFYQSQSHWVLSVTREQRLSPLAQIGILWKRTSWNWFSSGRNFKFETEKPYLNHSWFDRVRGKYIRLKHFLFPQIKI